MLTWFLGSPQVSPPGLPGSQCSLRFSQRAPAWPVHPPRMAWTKAEVGQGSIWVKKLQKMKVPRMEFSRVENLSGPQESIFSPFRGPQLHSRKQFKNWSNFIKLRPFPLLAHVGPMAVWGPLGCCCAKQFAQTRTLP